MIPYSSATDHIGSFSDISISTPHDICIPTKYDLNSLHVPSIASCSVNFGRLTVGRLSYISGIVKRRKSSGIAGGLPKGNYKPESVEFKR